VRLLLSPIRSRTGFSILVSRVRVIRTGVGLRSVARYVTDIIYIKYLPFLASHQPGNLYLPSPDTESFAGEA